MTKLSDPISPNGSPPALGRIDQLLGKGVVRKQAVHRVHVPRAHLLAGATVEDALLSGVVDGQRLGVVRSLDLLGEPLAFGVRNHSQAMPGRVPLYLDVVKSHQPSTPR